MIIVVCVIIVLVLILVISGCAFYFIWKAKRAVESFSRSAFGTSDIRQGFRQVEQEYAAVPKSVSAMTGL